MKKKAAVLIFFLIQYSYLYSQIIYPIPWASEQPKFVFPLFIEEATGMKDTVYFCYDPNSNLSQPEIADTVFGQKLIYVDTSKFYAYFENDHLCSGSTFECDSQYQVSVSKPISIFSQHFPNSFQHVLFHNGSFPLILRWDISTLYSDSLPFTSGNGLPKGQGKFDPSGGPTVIFSEDGQIWWNASGLPYSIILSDTSGSMVDSCIVTTVNNGGPFEVENFSFSLSIEQWTGVLSSISQAPEENDLLVFNNINDNVIYETKREHRNAVLSIYNLRGERLENFKIEDSKMIFESQYFLTSGIYILMMKCDQYILRKKVLIL